MEFIFSITSSYQRICVRNGDVGPPCKEHEMRSEDKSQKRGRGHMLLFHDRTNASRPRSVQILQHREIKTLS